MFTRCQNKLKTVGNLTVTNSLRDFNGKEMYLRLKNQSRSFRKRQKCSVFIMFEHSHHVIFKLCRLEFIFQNVPFSKSAGKKMCRFRVNGRPIRDIFHPFQNVWCLHHVKAVSFLNIGRVLFYPQPAKSLNFFGLPGA